MRISDLMSGKPKSCRFEITHSGDDVTVKIPPRGFRGVALFMFVFAAGWLRRFGAP